MKKEELSKFQEEFQFGTYYDEGGKTKPIMVKISECRILSLEEAIVI